MAGGRRPLKEEEGEIPSEGNFKKRSFFFFIKQHRGFFCSVNFVSMEKDVSHIPIVFYYYYNAFLYVSITTTLCGLPRYSPHVILWIIITLLILIQKDTTRRAPADVDGLPTPLTPVSPLFFLLLSFLDSLFLSD